MRMRSIAVTAAIVGLYVTPSIADDSRMQTVIAVPWNKFCLGSTGSSQSLCFMGHMPTVNCPVASVGLSELTGNKTKRLQITLHAKVNIQSGVRISIDQGSPLLDGPFAYCMPDGCLVSYDGGPELIPQLKNGRTLNIEAQDLTGQSIRVEISLVGFSQAYDQQPSSLEPSLREKPLQERWSELMRKLDRSLTNSERGRAVATILSPSCEIR